MAKLQYEGRDLEAMSYAPKYHRWILDIFRKFLGKRVAEVGAGSGNFTQILARESIDELVAIEPSYEMFSILEKRPLDKKVVLKHGFFEDVSLIYPNYFDSIIYVNVLEHVEKDDQELKHIFNSLKSGGTVCIFVPALMALFCDHDVAVGHFRRYSKKGLTSTIETAGFEILYISYFDILGIIPWFIFYKLFRKKMSGNDAKIYDTTAVPILSKLESIFPVPIGKNLIAVARKR